MTVATLTHTYPRFPDDINAPFVEHLMEHIAHRGDAVSVLTAWDEEWNRTPGDHTVDLRTYRYIWPSRFHLLGYSRTIEGNVRFRPHVYLLSPLLFWWGYHAFLNLVRELKPDVLHAHWLLPNGFIAARVSEATGVPLVIQMHGSDVFTAERNPLFRSMARYAASKARYLISPSPDMIRRLGAIGVDTSRIGLVPNGVEAAFADGVDSVSVAALRRDLGIAPDRRVVLALGRMVYVKGFSYLLEAFRSIAAADPSVVLVLGGDGVLAHDLRTQAHELGIENRVIMPGAVMRPDVPLYFAMADVFVVPSIRHESGAVDGLPVVIPEAMAAGVPVVATGVGGIPLLIRDGVNGHLVPERDSSAIAQAVSGLLADPDRRRLWGERSRRIIREHVNYDTLADHYRAVYHALASGVPADRMPSFTIPME